MDSTRQEKAALDEGVLVQGLDHVLVIEASRKFHRTFAQTFASVGVDSISGGIPCGFLRCRTVR